MEGEKRISNIQFFKELATEFWIYAIKGRWERFIGSIKFTLHGPDDILNGLSPFRFGWISEDDPFWKKRIEAAKKKKEEEEKRKKEEKEKKRKKRAEAVKRFRKVVTWFCGAAKKENEDAKRH